MKARAQVPSPKRGSFYDNVEVREYSRQFGVCHVFAWDGDWVTSLRFSFTFDKLKLFESVKLSLVGHMESGFSRI